MQGRVRHTSRPFHPSVVVGVVGEAQEDTLGAEHLQLEQEVIPSFLKEGAIVQAVKGTSEQNMLPLEASSDVQEMSVCGWVGTAAAECGRECQETSQTDGDKLEIEFTSASSLQARPCCKHFSVLTC